MRIDILTIFPEMFASVFDSSILKRAQGAGKAEVVIHNIRDYARDAHHTVDDAPYGGGAGMVMRADVLASAVEAVPVVGKKRQVVLMSAQGERFLQGTAREFSGLEQLVLVCGRYEGVDERFIEHFIDREISIGDYVLTGGEIPAMAVLDATVRLIPGVLGNAASLEAETFVGSLLEYPQYTRPAEFRGNKIPDVLLSGNHKEIKAWRKEQSLKRTAKRRPDLLKK
ncbi:MAG: tRNA (guanosine(37)-N1)-methyltransferase TrmD [Deltaproteobacteria bacterium RIFCSPLOWO2_02_FULL_47_10]|nr:MAG: tRNA (guanosine(37)-N1)-methyltransferase TrmD [Deltaproteobacteria bacterium RIFCSPLOWO2_02_FULL_47_10]